MAARFSLLTCFASLVLLANFASAGRGCPFCAEEKGATLIADMNQASMVLFGSFKDSRLGKDGFADATADFAIEKVIKSNEYLKGKDNLIVLPRYVTATKTKFLVFIDIFKGNLDPYRGVETTDGAELIKYVSGALAVKDKSPGERLRYAFDFLPSAEFEVSRDAYVEFAKADYKDYSEMAKKLPPDLIAGWLKDAKTPGYRYGLYSSLLGHCGNAEHAKILRGMLDDPEKRKGSGVDGMLVAYIMIQPKEGWEYLTRFLKEDQQDFLARYAGLRAIRFLWDMRPDLVPAEDLVKGWNIILDQHDMADFAMEDLAKRKRWEMTDRVLSYFGKESHDITVVKRAITRFALQAPEKKAGDFIRQLRQRDPEFVQTTEEILGLEVNLPGKK